MEPTAAPALLSKYRLAPSKERGQNFLIDPNVAAKVVEAVSPDRSEVVVEIGPGFGAITLGLAGRAKHVVAIECDAGLVRAFREEHGHLDRVTLLQGDALDLDPEVLAGQHDVPGVVIAGNLPYNLTSPALRLVIERGAHILRAVFMVQKEVAERLLAQPGSPEYSALTAILRFHATARARFHVRRTCFYPRPAVDSSVLEIVPVLGRGRTADPAVFSEVVHAAFGKRRKMLRQALLDLVRDAGSSADALAEESGIDLRRRGETLSVEEFETLAIALERVRH
jgi:16S rRNA (adenine1518-N6/adenine1519-N6)-dimethyltransferase